MSQDHPDIDRLISLHLSGRASNHEVRELEEWLNASSANRKMFERLNEIWAMSYTEENTENLEGVRDRIWATGMKTKPNRQPAVRQTIDWFYWTQVAAVFVVFFAGAWLFYPMVQKNASEPRTVAYVEKSNPAGQRSSHRLPDGTKVWLNASSSLIYPEEFSDTLRLVKLVGEAFFEVVKDRQKPFIVEAAGIRTEALGTAFNIQAYAEESRVTVALLEGKVRVQNKSLDQVSLLSPGEELYAPKDNQAFTKKRFDYESTFGWKEGILLFDGADFKSFRKTIERWYGVKVSVKGTAPDDWQIRAKYQREELEHILLDISFNKNIQFELKDKEVLIIF